MGSEEHERMSRRIAGVGLATIDRWNVKRLPYCVRYAIEQYVQRRVFRL